MQKIRQHEQPSPVPEAKPDANVQHAIQELERILGTKVKIVGKAKKGGRIEIQYYSEEELQRIYAVIAGEP